MKASEGLMKRINLADKYTLDNEGQRMIEVIWKNLKGLGKVKTVHEGF